MKYFILGLAGQPVLWTLLVSRTDIYDTRSSRLETWTLPNTDWPARLGLPVLLFELFHLTLNTAACLGIVRLEI